MTRKRTERQRQREKHRRNKDIDIDNTNDKIMQDKSKTRQTKHQPDAGGDVDEPLAKAHRKSRQDKSTAR
jgi:hypothetical protein